jgi:hypothetical protein
MVLVQLTGERQWMDAPYRNVRLVRPSTSSAPAFRSRSSRRTGRVVVNFPFRNVDLFERTRRADVAAELVAEPARANA